MTPNKYDVYFEKLETMHGIKLTPGQRNWYQKKAEVLQEDMLKEYPSTPEEAFEVNTSGLYYASYISAARNTHRIINLPYDPTLKVHTAWDLGFSDANSIIFFTISGKEIHIIDYLEGSGISMTDYIKKVKQKDYIYGTHLAPHDIRIHEYSTGVARIDTANKLGISFVIVPDIPVLDGIDAVRNIFPRLYFNTNDAVKTLVNRIETYTQKWDATLGVWSGRPVHDVSSHAGDCLRYLAVGLSLCLDDSQSISQEMADALWKQHGRKI